MLSLNKLREKDAASKPMGFDKDCEHVLAYYEDASRALTRARLAELGVGFKNASRPLELNLVRRVVDRIATVYSEPAMRWLRDAERKRVPEEDPRHVALQLVLARAQYDLAWRRADRLRAGVRQVVLRAYPSDPRGGVVVRCFAPHRVVRDPSPSAPNLMDEDRAFALELAGGVWELWENTADGWRMQVVNDRGALMPGQPFADMPDELSPYPELPAQIVYDELSDHAWLSPRASRVAVQEVVNAMANDLHSLVVQQAHSERYVTTDRPNAVPDESGPGTRSVYPDGATVGVVNSQPKIQESGDVLERIIRLWLESEDLPASELDSNRQIVTGAALRSLERPLLARRKAQVPLAPEDERLFYRRFRGVHNLHAGSTSAWDLDALDELGELEVEIADMQEPVDDREVQETGAKNILLGTASVIDLIMRQQSCTRSQAVATWERVRRDNELYPPHRLPLQEGGGEVTLDKGPRLAGVAEAARKPSMVQALEGAGDDAA